MFSEVEFEDEAEEIHRIWENSCSARAKVSHEVTLRQLNMFSRRYLRFLLILSP
jgi:hypothetical protein